jgi:hypothetical protein
VQGVRYFNKQCRIGCVECWGTVLEEIGVVTYWMILRVLLRVIMGYASDMLGNNHIHEGVFQL